MRGKKIAGYGFVWVCMQLFSLVVTSRAERLSNPFGTLVGLRASSPTTKRHLNFRGGRHDIDPYLKSLHFVVTAW